MITSAIGSVVGEIAFTQKSSRVSDLWEQFLDEDCHAKKRFLKQSLLLTFLVAMIFMTWRITRPVQIVGVYRGNYASDIIIKNPLLTAM